MVPQGRSDPNEIDTNETSCEQPVRIIGIDPGLRTTGYGVLEFSRGKSRLLEAGVLRVRANQPIEQRLQELHSGIAELLLSLRPQQMALEELYSHYERPRTAILMGHARGVLCLAAAQAGIPLVSYAATMVKRMLTGSGHAPKSQMQAVICREFDLATAPDPPDVADALAIALCHAYSQRGQRLQQQVVHAPRALGPGQQPRPGR